MAATAKAGTPPSRRKPPARPQRPVLPPVDDEVISIGAPAEDEPVPEPERVPLFEINGTMYTMLREPPVTLSLESLQVADEKGGAGYAEIYVIREMIGSAALNALFDARKKGWLKKPQLDKIMTRVQEAAFGPVEDDSPNR